MYRQAIRHLIDEVALTEEFFRAGIVAIDITEAEPFTGDRTGHEDEIIGTKEQSDEYAYHTVSSDRVPVRPHAVPRSIPECLIRNRIRTKVFLIYNRISSHVTRSDSPDNTRNRRRFLKGLGALSIVGLAGCGDDGDGTDEPADTTEPMETTEPPEDTTVPPEDTTEPSEKTTEPPEKTTEPPTTTEPGDDIPDEDPATLLSFSDAPIVDAGQSTTITGSITNPYLFDVEDGTVELEGPDGWELSPAEGTTFDTLESQSAREASWEISLPEGADGEYELTATVTYSVAEGDDSADVTATLPITVDVWIGNEFTEVAHFEDIWENGIEDRMWENPQGEVQDGQGPSNWYQYRMDLSAFLPAGKIQIRIEDSFKNDGWGASIWDISLERDGEEVTYARVPYNDEEYLYENNASVDDFSEEQQWRFADAQDYLIYEFEVPDDPEELVAEITLRNGFIFSVRSSPPADVSKEDTSTTMTPALRVAYTGDSGGGVQDNEFTGFFLAPEVGLPHGPTYTYMNEDAIDKVDESEVGEERTPDQKGWDDVSAEFFFGYDEDNLYLRAEVTDDQHAAIGGADMWQADSLQIAAGNGGEYGPEMGVARVDGGTDTHQWVEGGGAGIDAIDASTGRDGTLTTYDLTIPWDALYENFTAEAGANAPFGVLINEADADDGERDAVLGWTLPGVNEEKSVDAIGTLLLENPLDGDGG